MDEKRMGEIALALLRYKTAHEDIHLPPRSNLDRDFGNVAKETGVPLPELKAFTKAIFKEAIVKRFGE